MNYYYGMVYLLGLCLSLSSLWSQGKLKDLQQIQLLSQDECVIVQVNADWNAKASINLGRLKNCKWFNASIDDKKYGAVLAKEWSIKSVPTIVNVYPLSSALALVIDILFPALSVNDPPLIELPFNVNTDEAVPD